MQPAGFHAAHWGWLCNTAYGHDRFLPCIPMQPAEFHAAHWGSLCNPAYGHDRFCPAFPCSPLGQHVTQHTIVLIILAGIPFGNAGTAPHGTTTRPYYCRESVSRTSQAARQAHHEIDRLWLVCSALHRTVRVGKIEESIALTLLLRSHSNAIDTCADIRSCSMCVSS